MEENGDIEEFRGKQRGRPKGKRGRGKTGGKSKNIKQQIESDGEDDCKIVTEKEEISPKFDENCDISSLEAPTFTTLNRGPPAPMLKLSWNHPVTLIGEKVVSPRIHTCDTCDKPILIYGRMIPCKHVFCLTCAKSEDRVCSRCGECVARVEQTGLGTVFMCSYTINEALCKRTYLSQRDLQAHIDHRHVKSTSNAPKEEHKENILSYRDPRAEGRANDQRHPPHVRNLSNDPRISGHKEGFEANPQIMRNINPGLPSPQGHAPSSQPNLSHHIPVMTSSRSNLISIPIEDQVEPPFSAQSAQNYPAFHHVQNQQPGLRSSLPHSLHPPPQRAFASPPPVAHSQHMQFPVTSSFNYSNSQPNPHNSYPPTNAIPQNSHVPSHYASSHNPVPVPPPTTFGNQFSGSQQWPAPPPRLARPMAPSSLGQHPTTHPQNITYYR